jgi:hypothetical protein
MPMFRKASHRNVGVLDVVRFVFSGLCRIAEFIVNGAFRRGLPTALTWDGDPASRRTNDHPKAKGLRRL